MQRGDFRNTAARQAELERREERRKQRRLDYPMTQAQGERIIELLEQLVANGTPGSPEFNEALDKVISYDVDLKNGIGG